MANAWVELPLRPIGKPAPLGATIPDGRSVGNYHHLGSSPHRSSRCCLRSAYGGWRPPEAQAHWLRGQGVLPLWWLLPKEYLRGIAAPSSAGPRAKRTASLAQVMVFA